MKHSALLRSRSKLASSLSSTSLILRGSLLHRHIRHRSGCSVCANGDGHPVSVLAVSYPGGRTKHISLRPSEVPVVQQWLRNYRDLQDELERICELNQQLLIVERNDD